jgi:hypothetical protein
LTTPKEILTSLCITAVRAKQAEKRERERQKKQWEDECKNENGEIIKNKIVAKGKEKPRTCEEIFKE